MDDGIASGRCESLLGGCGHEVELVGVTVGDSSINHCAWLRVLELSDVASDQSSVHTLAHVDVHQLCLAAHNRYRCLDLLNFWATDWGNLALTNTITVEDESCWVGATISFLECF